MFSSLPSSADQFLLLYTYCPSPRCFYSSSSSHQLPPSPSSPAARSSGDFQLTSFQPWVPRFYAAAPRLSLDYGHQPSIAATPSGAGLDDPVASRLRSSYAMTDNSPTSLQPPAAIADVLNPSKEQRDSAYFSSASTNGDSSKRKGHLKYFILQALGIRA